MNMDTTLSLNSLELSDEILISPIPANQFFIVESNLP